MSDPLDEQEFYELMQTYRHTPLGRDVAVHAAFEAVKAYVRGVVRAAPREPSPAAITAAIVAFNRCEIRGIVAGHIDMADILRAAYAVGGVGGDGA